LTIRLAFFTKKFNCLKQISLITNYTSEPRIEQLSLGHKC